MMNDSFVRSPPPTPLPLREGERKDLLLLSREHAVDSFPQRHDLLRDAKVVADVGVFRSYPSMQFGPRQTAKLTGEVEDLLIANRCAFQLVFDQQLDELSRWPVLVMPVGGEPQTIEVVPADDAECRKWIISPEEHA